MIHYFTMQVCIQLFCLVVIVDNKWVWSCFSVGWFLWCVNTTCARCVCACVRACVRACVSECVRACVCVRARVRMTYLERSRQT